MTAATKRKPRAAAGEARSAPTGAGRAPSGRASAAGRVEALATLANASEGRFPSSLYVDGPNEAIKAVFLADFRRAWAAAVPQAPAARVMRPGEDGVDAILSAYHGISMFTPRELTLVLNVEDLGRSEKRVAALAEGVARPAGESCLVLVESAADAPRKTLDPLRAAAAALWSAESLDSRGLLAWGRRRLAAEALAEESGALEALVETCEGETVAFFNELGKLVAWSARSGRVTRADVDALSRPIVGAELPEYLLAVASGQPGLAAQRLGRILAAGESEGGVMFALGNLVGGAMGGWARYKELSALLARRRSPRELAAALDAVYRAEAAWKSGRADALAALEQASREVAAS